MLGRHPDLILWWREGQRFSQHLQRVHVAHINVSQLVLAHSYNKLEYILKEREIIPTPKKDKHFSKASQPTDDQML